MFKKPQGSKLFTSNSVYGQGVLDNGEKWGSYVKKEPNGMIPFDEKFFKENPKRWQSMMDERMNWLCKKNDGSKTHISTTSPTLVWKTNNK